MPSFNWSVGVCMCVTFVVFTDYESCTSPISTNSVSMEAGEYGLTRGARFVALCLEVVAVARLMWVSWRVFGGAIFFSFFRQLHFQIRARPHDRWLRETQSSQRRLGEGATTATQFAHRELVPTYPHQVYHLSCSHQRDMASSVR